MSGSERQQKAFALDYCAGAFVTEGTLNPLMAFVLMCPTELLLTPAQGRALTSKREQVRSSTVLRSFSATASSSAPSLTRKWAS